MQEAFDSLANQGAQGPVSFHVVAGYNPALEPATIQVKGFAWVGQPAVVSVWVHIPVTISKAPTVASRALFRIGGGSENINGFELHGLGNLTLRETQASMG
ncbi:MAG: hypothetical protein RMK98_04630, partial [Bacteroidia bacterium]|nr:hypothetical protein [Bacteroidia bacterium]